MTFSNTAFPSPTSVAAAALPLPAALDPITLQPEKKTKNDAELGVSNDEGNHHETTMEGHNQCLRKQEATLRHQHRTYESLRGPWPVLVASDKSRRTINPIRAIVDPIVAAMKTEKGSQNDGKGFISLALGDPVSGQDLQPCPEAVDSILDTLRDPCHRAGYAPACGTEEARAAIARFHSVATASATRTNAQTDDDPSKVIVANGCSGALELALTSLMNANENAILLIPKPGFPLYQVITESHGARVMHYPLCADQGWQVDLCEVESLILQVQNSSEYHNESFTGHQRRDRICGIVINNPSNPTGAVYTKQHLQDLLALCDKYHIPVVADEVYHDLAFPPNIFYPLAQVSHEMGRRVPVITASGIGKQFLVPGWRVGWIVFHDNIYGSLREIHAGAQRLAQVILGASHLAQTAIPVLLDTTNRSVLEWKQDVHAKLTKQAHFLCQQLAMVPGLEVFPPQGAMYAMVKIHPEYWDDSIQNDVDFCKLVLKEENVLVLPGSCFNVDNIFRVVFCASIPTLQEASQRIKQFCHRHYREKGV